MRLIITLLALLSLPALAFSATIVVPDDFATIQGAINAATAGDIILVKPGTYNENINLLGKDLEIRSDLDVVVDTVDLAPDLTIIDGGLATSVITFSNSETSACKVKGFTIKNGKGTWNPPTLEYLGGGVYINNADPTVANNLFLQNDADQGGGIYVNDSSSLLADNTFILNNASKSGGGIHVAGGASCTITQSLFKFNIAGETGGGIAIRDFSNGTTVFNNIIDNNTADNGSGIECFSASPNIVNNIIKNNKADLGGGLYCYTSNALITNNTFFRNEANPGGQGGALYCFWNSDPILTNNIMWNDTGAGGPDEISIDGTSNPTVTYCDIEGGTGAPWFGVGCIDTDPMFLDAAGFNLHLSTGSPCIEAGINTAPALPTRDFNFETRINGTVDMGIDEYYAYPALELHVPSQYLTIQDAIDAAADTSTIYVQGKFQNEGDYVETLDFGGKTITVRSDKDANPATHDIDPMNTTIDANGAGSVVRFISGEGNGSVLEGFTLKNGTGTSNIYNVNGGGIYCNASSPTILNNIIRDNSCEFGAGIHCEDCSPTISGNTIQYNTATLGGAGIMGIRCDALISKNSIRWNTSAFAAGGIGLFQYCDTEIYSNMITDNTAEFGGGIAAFWSAPDIVNNTFVGNVATLAGGAVYGDWNSMITIKNAILWGNSSPSGTQVATNGYSSTTLDFSCVQSGLAGISTAAGCTLLYGYAGSGINITTKNPIFVDASNNNYKISATDSPCVNRGTNIGAPAEDIDGEIIPTNSLADMGADEIMGPFTLTADSTTISASLGGSVNFYVDAGLAHVGRNYYLLAGVIGTTPGTTLSPGVELPLYSPDPVTNFVKVLMNSPVFANFSAPLDVNGQGTGTMTLAPGLIPPGNEGLMLYFAYYLLSPKSYPSNVVGVEVIL